MTELKTRWSQLNLPIKVTLIAVAAVFGVVLALKILPSLISVMGYGLLFMILVVPYWIPTILAFTRAHPDKIGILALNLFLGWTFVGWVVSLVWAVSGFSGRVQPIVVNTTVMPNLNADGGTQLPPTQYQVGDIVNDHRFDGASWVPLRESSKVPAPPPAPPALADTTSASA